MLLFPPDLLAVSFYADLQVAARTASAFNPNVHITPIHGNIKDTQFDLTWFQGFDIVLNALDNLGSVFILSLRREKPIQSSIRRPTTRE
jgi:tRNA A37 threonylcarbamoyladenosine dehydratase